MNSLWVYPSCTDGHGPHRIGKASEPWRQGMWRWFGNRRKSYHTGSEHRLVVYVSPTFHLLLLRPHPIPVFIPVISTLPLISSSNVSSVGSLLEAIWETQHLRLVGWELER
jgi:hypothetical protein